MENATKALLIAAAVLVAILIISLGIGIFNMASEQVNNAGDLSEYEIQQFNEKFTQYEGTSVSASDVNAMIKAVFNHNLAQDDSRKRVAIYLDNTMIMGSLTSFDGSESPANVPAGKRYKVYAGYNNYRYNDTDSGAGMIRRIFIETL